MYKIFVLIFLLMLVSACSDKNPSFWERKCYVGEREISTTIWRDDGWGRKVATYDGLDCALCVCTWERISNKDAWLLIEESELEIMETERGGEND